jgi:hypothetical protein
MTGIKAAFEKAGYKNSTEEWPSEDLLDVAVRAMVRHADDGEATQHAIFRACRNDAALLRQLILPWWRQCTAQLINEARRSIARKQREDALETPMDRRAAKVVSLIMERDRKESQREAAEEAARVAALNKRHEREFKDRLEAWNRTKASSFTIDDRPFWEVSTFRARQAQRRSEHESRFLDLVLAGVPEDDRPIGHYRRPEEINTLWDQSFVAPIQTGAVANQVGRR